MNWITNYVRPKLDLFGRKPMPDNLWVKDPESGEMVFQEDLAKNQYVVPTSGFHMAIRAADRLAHFLDTPANIGGKYERLPQPQVATDPLKFRDERKYTDKLKENRQKAGTEDTIVAATGKLHGMDVTVCVQDFKFMGGSLGMAAGEAIIASMEEAVRRDTPYILFAASGGARMQEGILSLMQLPRTTVAVQMLKEAGLPYMVVLTNPTTGGVTASYAMLGDIHIAEPGALICFAGPRVIEQTIREKLPEGFQRAEYLQEHGMIDMVVPRTELRDTIANLLSILTKRDAPKRPVVEPDAPQRETEAIEKEASAAVTEPTPKTVVAPAPAPAQQKSEGEMVQTEAMPKETGKLVAQTSS